MIARAVDARPEIAGDAVALRRAEPGDCEAIWAWNFAPDVRARSRRAEAVAYLEHARWFTRRIADGVAPIWVIEEHGRGVGVIRLDPSHGGDPRPAGEAVRVPTPRDLASLDRVDAAAEHGRARISIALASSARGRGIGRAAIAAVCRTWRRPILAEIFDDNLASRACFAACGFHSVGAAHGLVTYHWDPRDPRDPRDPQDLET
jgi:L-amino acid N-acyltransferase YncA